MSDVNEIEKRVTRVELEIEALKQVPAKLDLLNETMVGVRSDLRSYSESNKSFRARLDASDRMRIEDRIKMGVIQDNVLIINTKLRGAVYIIGILFSAVIGLFFDLLRRLI